MEHLIEILESYQRNKNFTTKYDIVCGLRGIVSILEGIIQKIESTEIKGPLKIGELGFQKEWKNNKLMGIRQVKFENFDWLDKTYIFRIGNENSSRRLIISSECYPKHFYGDGSYSEITKT